MDKTILVTGATGSQGGALIPLLINQGFKIRALTRDPSKPSAQALSALGVEVVAGDMDNEASLEAACEGCYGVFSVQNFWEKGVGHEREVEQGCKLARAAKKADIKHFVQTSVANCDRSPGVLHFESKYKIEQYIDSLKLPRTFLREVFFLDNFTLPVLSTGEKKEMDPYWIIPTIVAMLDKNTRFHMIAVEDIAWFAADVFSHPELYMGKALDVAGDLLTPAEMKAIFHKVTGKRLLPSSRFITRLIMKFSNPEMTRQFKWNNDLGWQFDLAPLQARHPELITFETFLRKHYSNQ